MFGELDTLGVCAIDAEHLDPSLQVLHGHGFLARNREGLRECALAMTKDAVDAVLRDDGPCGQPDAFALAPDLP